MDIKDINPDKDDANLTASFRSTGPTYITQLGKKRPIDWVQTISAIVFYVVGSVASVMLIIVLAGVIQTYANLANAF